MEARNLVILGSTGSVGTSTLEVVRKHKDRFSVFGLVAGNNIDLVAKQVQEFKPKYVSVKTEEGAKNLRKLLPTSSPTQFLTGVNGACEMVQFDEVHTVVSAIVGAAGLKPTLAAAQKGKRIALANKETLVVAGALVSQVAREYHSEILPVDSEHSAIFQALSNSPKKHVRKLILTASGGPFFKQPELDLSKVSVEAALNHPNWKMGQKITIDSATLMNKGLEVIEAKWLFGFNLGQIDVVIHPQSMIHSMVEFIDGSVLAQLGVPDMKGPISYALAYPDRLGEVMDFVNFAKVRSMEFFEPDHTRFPSINLCRQALTMGETFSAVLNGANEVTVAAFLDRKIKFLDIHSINRRTLEKFKPSTHGSLEDFINADHFGRQTAKEEVESIKC